MSRLAIATVIFLGIGLGLIAPGNIRVAAQSVASVTYDRILTLGGTQDDIGQGLVLDSSGNAYLTGHFEKLAKFGALAVTAGERDYFVAKADNAGRPLWMVSGGVAGSAIGRAIALAPNGGVYVAGTFGGTLPIAGTNQVAAGVGDAFVARYSSSGTLLWRRQFGGPSATLSDSASRAVSDSTGSLILTGQYSGPVSFDLITLPDLGSTASFVMKISPSGEVRWARTLGTAMETLRRALAVDGANNSYVGVPFTGTISGSIPTLTARPGGSLLLAKLSPAGEFLWATAGGGDAFPGDNQAQDLAVDSTGSLILVGSYLGRFIWGDLELRDTAGTGPFIARFDPSGRPHWLRGPYVSGGGTAGGVATDGDGNVYVAGFIVGNARFENISFANGPRAELYVVSYTSEGRQQWLEHAGGMAYMNPHNIRFQAPNRLHVEGYFRGNSTFGPLFAPNQGARDAFILTLRVPREPRLAIAPVESGWSLTWSLDADGYGLEAIDELGTRAPWSRRGLDPGVLNDRYGLVAPHTATNRYFRLRPLAAP